MYKYRIYLENNLKEYKKVCYYVDNAEDLEESFSKELINYLLSND
ncbi:hypothetical protein J11TS1_27380 [Oceanobacillus sp. J11TS1]|nr:hypothetical protein J11TS1_27380 [Oceanobacillus sp. J11TS1]